MLAKAAVTGNEHAPLGLLIAAVLLQGGVVVYMISRWLRSRGIARVPVKEEAAVVETVEDQQRRKQAEAILGWAAGFVNRVAAASKATLPRPARAPATARRPRMAWG